MAFNDLPPQPPIWPSEAEAYARNALELSQAAAARLRVEQDIPYGDDYWQRIDIYLPEDREAHGLPVLLFAHGGAWTHGYKEWMGLMAPPIVALPAIFVSVSYRLAPENRYPVPAEDCAAALAWVHANIARYGGDPGRLFVGGHSAGGHLFALVALQRDLLAAHGLAPEIVKGCFPVSSQMNLVFPRIEPGSGEERIHTVFLRSGEDASPASPIAHAEGNRVPFLLSYGTRDFPRIIKSNQEMEAVLHSQPSGVEVLLLENYDHFDTALQLQHPANPWVGRALELLAGAQDIHSPGILAGRPSAAS